MSIIKLIANRKLAGLIVSRGAFASASASAPPPLNSPPVWDTQPNPQFVDGFPSNYPVGGLVSDPDGDPVTINNPVIEVPGVLPDGITWDSSAVAFIYDGTTIASAAYTSAILYLRATDGTDSTNSDTWTLSIADGSTFKWPAYDAHVVGGYNVSSYPVNFQDDPYRTWNAKKDLIIAQHRYPFASQVAAEIADTNWMRTQNSNIKMQHYTFKSVVEQLNPNSAKALSYEVMTEQGTLAEWRAYSPSNDPILWDGDVVGRIVANTNYANNPTSGSTYADFSIAWWNKIKTKYNDQWTWDGYFWDSTDYKDSKPGYTLESDPSVSSDNDYWVNFDVGDADPKWWRLGVVYDIGVMRSVGPSTLFAASNGGRDGDAVNDPIADNEWADIWDCRLSENSQTKLGLVTTGNVFEVEFGNPDSRLDILFRAMCISEDMVDFSASNRLGKGMVVMDYVMGWTGTIPTTIAEIPQAHYAAARFVCGLCCLQDNWMAAPVLTRGSYTFPYPDEYVYDPGQPIGSTPSFATIDSTIAGASPVGFPLTVRTPDQAATSGNYGVYWQEFDNVLWVVNMNEPTGNGASWPQATKDTITLPSADLGSGQVWRYADSNYVNTSRTTGATAAENHSPAVNTGGLTGSTIQLGRWEAIMLVRSNPSAPTVALTVNSTNPRYFDYDGQTIWLGGHQHMRPVVSQASQIDIPAIMDVVGDIDVYIAALLARGMNYIRFLHWFGSSQIGGLENSATPLPFRRTGPGNANDGDLKFDLTLYDTTYDARLLSFCEKCFAAGIIVSVNFWDVYGVSSNRLQGSCFTAANNINSVDADVDGDGQGYDGMYGSPSGTMETIMTNYEEHIVDMLNHLPNVFYEGPNELYDMSFHTTFVTRMQSYIGTKTNTQLVMISHGGRTDDGVGSWGTFTHMDKAEIIATGADVVTPGASTGGLTDWEPTALDFRNNPPVHTEFSLPIIADLDHIQYGLHDHVHLWKCFTRGYHYNIYEDGPDYVEPKGWETYLAEATDDVVRRNIGVVQTLIGKCTNLENMVPSTSAASTTYCLYWAGEEYIVWSESASTFNVFELSSGSTYDVEWWDTDTFSLASTTTRAVVGTSDNFTPPSANHVLFLKKQ